MVVLAPSCEADLMATVSKKTPAVIAEVLRRIGAGEPYASIHRSDRERFPCKEAWIDWVKADPDLELRYAEARRTGADHMAEYAMQLADEVQPDKGHIAKARLQIDTRLKLLACWYPNRYGQKATVDIGNKEGETFKTEGGINADDLRTLTDALLAPKGKD